MSDLLFTNYLAHGQQIGSPFVDFYGRSGDLLIRLPAVADALPGTGLKSCWSPDGSLMTLGHSASPYMTTYSRSGFTFTKLSNPASLPSASFGGPQYSPDGTLLVGGSSVSPYLQLYSVSGTTLTKLTDPPAADGTVSMCKWSPDGTLLIVLTNTSPFLNLYSRSGNTLTKLTSPDAAHATIAPLFGAFEWSPDSSMFVCACGSGDTSHQLYFYTRSGNTLTKGSGGPTTSAGGWSAAAWSPDGALLALGATSDTPYLFLYSVSGTTFTNVGSVDTAAKPDAQNMAWTPDSRLLIHSQITNTPRINIYERSGNALTTKPAPPESQGGNGVSISANVVADAPYSAVRQVTSGSTATSGTSTIAPAYPTSVIAHCGLILMVGQKPLTANGGGVTTPSGWTLIASKTAAGGYSSTLGVDTGNVNLYAYFKDADGTETGTVTVTLADSDVTWAKIIRFDNPYGLWRVDAAVGEDTDGSSSTVSITGDKNLILSPGDIVVGGFCTPTDAASNFSAEAFSATGVTTWNTVFELAELPSSTGNDIGGFISYGLVLDGVSSAAPVMTATSVDTTNGSRGAGIIVSLKAIKPISGSDLVSSTESGTATIPISSSDTGSFVDDGTAAEATIAKSESDSVSGVDNQQSLAGYEVPDTGTSAETQSLVVDITSDDSMALVDVESLTVTLIDADDFSLAEDELIGGGISEYIISEEQWTIDSDLNSNDVWSGTDSEVLGQADSDGSTQAVETEVIIAELIVDESLLISETSILNLTDTDSFTYVETQDVAFSTFADDSSSLTIESEEVNELVYVSDDEPLLLSEELSVIDVEVFTSDLTSGLDEEFYSAILTEADDFLSAEDELSAGPTGIELISTLEEAWVDTTLTSVDVGLISDAQWITQDVTDLGSTVETEEVSVGLFSDDSGTGLDSPILTGLDSLDVGVSLDAHLVEAEIQADQSGSGVETELTPDVFAGDFAIASEELVVIDLSDADSGACNEAFLQLEVQVNDLDLSSLVDEGDAGSSIGDEGEFEDISFTSAISTDVDSFTYIDLGYVDVPVEELLTGLDESGQVVNFDGDPVSLDEVSLVGILATESLSEVEVESLDSDLSSDDQLVWVETELVDVLSTDDLIGVDAETPVEATLFSDDPFAVIDDHQITQTTDKSDNESITASEALLVIEFGDSDSSSSSEQIAGFGFAEYETGTGLDSSLVGQLSLDLFGGVETQAITVSIFSDDSLTGSEGYLGTELSAGSDLAGLIDSGDVVASLAEADSGQGIDTFIQVELIDDDLGISTEVNDVSATMVDDDPISIVEIMVALEATLEDSENQVFTDSQSDFLGDSFTDDEVVVDAVEDEEVVQLIVDDDTILVVEEETLPAIVPQGIDSRTLTIMRKLTVSMIKTNPIAIVLIPEIKVRKDNGTVSYEDGIPRTIQTFMLIPMSYQTKPTQIVDGVERVIDYTLLGRWDAEMQRGDHWLGSDGKHYKIIELVPYMPYPYETKGLVEAHG